MTTTRPRLGIFGWGLVGPKSPDIDAFARNLASAESWLAPFDGYGPSNFLVGTPSFDFDVYEPCVKERFAPRHFQRLVDKMDYPALYAVGAFIQALGQNPGLEQALQQLDTVGAHVLGAVLNDPDGEVRQYGYTYYHPSDYAAAGR